jgi:hypothetical protein
MISSFSLLNSSQASVLRIGAGRRWATRVLSSAPSPFAFSLDKSFVDKYENKPSPFGFNGLGEVVYLRTYSRKINDHEREKWFQTVERVSE